ncbi:mucin-like glycoprotein [Trypanosoma rangeli]|uniref:Mucin-like glycoprotein n=1 Tax=Trypanosoma rangeli TaxID=5698 RepID=A0A3R7K878_TRYRA|nr:mucin-like glycoprotein [Trypanosoma rangeli]RNE95739.1 mucin-like glycoprotein [Trypanosoma rangeli]|eukprot:RNE95739.1 mucin-like glycoprotein [Trypanosoma rangeli]
MGSAVCRLFFTLRLPLCRALYYLHRCLFPSCFFLHSRSLTDISSLPPATLLLLSPLTPRQMAMATVRRRAVCALAILALLCGCCSLVCGAKPTAKKVVSVQVSCAGADRKASWRVPGEQKWEKCGITVDDSMGLSGKMEDPRHYLCAWVAVYYKNTKCCGKPPASTAKTTTFTMNCTTDEDGMLYKRWLKANKGDTSFTDSSSDPYVMLSCRDPASRGFLRGEVNDAPEECGEEVVEEALPGEEAKDEVAIHREGGGEPQRREGEQREGPAPTTQVPAPAERAPGAGGERALQDAGDGHPTAANGAASGGGGANDAPTAAKRADGGAAPGAAAHQPHESGRTQTPSTSQDESDAPGPTPSASGADATPRATAATRNGTTGEVMANSADLSVISTPFVRPALLLLLLAAALAAHGVC